MCRVDGCSRVSPSFRVFCLCPISTNADPFVAGILFEHAASLTTGNTSPAPVGNRRFSSCVVLHYISSFADLVSFR
jgi:hypothetical protein